jgi:hypothetical protein
MIVLSKRYKTKGGRSVDLTKITAVRPFSVQGTVYLKDNSKRVFFWTNEGKFWLDGRESQMDLVEYVKPTKKRSSN